jgi:hypothetical protein
MALVRERTIPTERPPPVGEVSANYIYIYLNCTECCLTKSSARLKQVATICGNNVSRLLKEYANAVSN